MTHYIHIPNQFVTTADGVQIAYRDYGNPKGDTLLLFVHLAANLDNWRPELLDLLAEKHRIITFDYCGVGLSEGEQPLSIAQMAKDSLQFIDALQLDKVHLLGFSMGGFVVQELIPLAPKRFDKVVLAGTGLRGRKDIDRITPIADKHTLKAIFTFKDPKYYMFFNQNKNGKQKANEFLQSLKQRKENRDKPISWKSYRRQLKAITLWGKAPQADLSAIKQPTLVVNGDNDVMVRTEHSYTLAKNIPNSKLIIYPDAGHGAAFQEYTSFANEVLNFLK